ncbi:hypothetical protein DRN73_05000 [Candidatus Pacearchaeota archaeon]|nr:MAG: hypothetical protein DRN73_05000 [Candidatus Pacearchaeota archaeon]
MGIEKTFKKFELDVSGLNTAESHERFLDFLKRKDYFDERYLFRGSDENELRIIQGFSSRRKRNFYSDFDLVDETGEEEIPDYGIFCYTLNELREISKEGGTHSPVKLALDLDIPLIFVLKTEEFDKGDDYHDNLYLYKNPHKKLQALEAVVYLK